MFERQGAQYVGQAQNAVLAGLFFSYLLLNCCCSLTKRARAGGCAGRHYPFLTQKERDVETGLDYFLARYYSSTQGRFSGVDRYDINVERQSIADDNQAEQTFASYISQPQHWNRYAYAINNPLKYIDPLGEAIELTGTEEERKKQSQEYPDNEKIVQGKSLPIEKR
jgi:RHS repeat-associated protein